MATKTHLYWLAAAVWGVLIAWFSIRPLEVVGVIEVSDVVSHFVAYLILTALLFLSLKSINYKHAAAFSVLFAFCYGAVLELIQGIIPNRVLSFIDAGVNGFGAVVSGFVLHYKNEIEKLVKR